jgi:hypothetical protein
MAGARMRRSDRRDVYPDGIACATEGRTSINGSSESVSRIVKIRISWVAFFDRIGHHPGQIRMKRP